MGPTRIAFVAVTAVLALAVVAYLFWPWREEVVPPPPPPPAAAVPAAPPGPRHPVPSEAAGELPALGQSDAVAVEALAGLVGGLDAVARWFNAEGLVRNIVATVDNLPRETVVRRVNPLLPVPGLPVTRGRDATLAFAPENAKRYESRVAAFESLDTARTVAAYRRLYPLFQQAYVELGYPNGYFNDRLVEVIDHLLATPEPAGPVALVQPKVLYEYADPSLEERSAGQKAMLRLGASNAARVKAKLRELRAAVAASPP